MVKSRRWQSKCGGVKDRVPMSGGGEVQRVVGMGKGVKGGSGLLVAEI